MSKEDIFGAHLNNVCPTALVEDFTASSQEMAQSMAKQLLDKKLIACANLLPPHKSIYQWEGQLCQEEEHIVILKSRKSLAQKVETEIKNIHPYECPCILQFESSQSNREFYQWLLAQTGHD